MKQNRVYGYNMIPDHNEGEGGGGQNWRGHNWRESYEIFFEVVFGRHSQLLLYQALPEIVSGGSKLNILEICTYPPAIWYYFWFAHTRHIISTIHDCQWIWKNQLKKLLSKILKMCLMCVPQNFKIVSIYSPSTV